MPKKLKRLPETRGASAKIEALEMDESRMGRPYTKQGYLHEWAYWNSESQEEMIGALCHFEREGWDVFQILAMGGSEAFPIGFRSTIVLRRPIDPRERARRLRAAVTNASPDRS